ncbi:MAG: end-binding protein Ku [Candidatus Angelobacter sp.]|nr:end-binding protein Ku [Candidatus Angelobacter sp.]
MAASVWTGYLTFGLISMPVRLFSGARPHRISFHMLHRDDHVRVKQQLVCPAEERPVERNEIVKGYEYRKGEYVVIEPEEIKKIEPKTAKAMEILEFVKEEEIDPVYFESSYYLAPEEAAIKPYALLVKTMKDTGYVGVAKLAMHNREYTAFLRPYEKGLMLHTMYYKDEIREAPDVGTDHVNLKEGEVKVAHQLIEALASKWDPAKYYDTFEENMKKLIKAHLEGKEVVAIDKPRPAAAPTDLMAALKQSLAQMEGKKKGPQRVEAAQRESEIAVKGKPKSVAGKKKPPKRAA